MRQDRRTFLTGAALSALVPARVAAEDGELAPNAGWDEVPEPRDLRAVSDTIVNVQTGTGNRIEFWDGHGTPYDSIGKVRRYIDIGRLTKGR